MNYTMLFMLSPDFEHTLLLHKPETHCNPLFRGLWTAPGGHIEVGETEVEATIREVIEETQLVVRAPDLRFVLRLMCNCDPDETEHEVAVYGSLIRLDYLRMARGLPDEPVHVFKRLPENLLWHVEPLRALTITRMKQP